MYGDKNKEKLARKTEAPKGVRELDIGTEWRQMLQEKKEEGKRESKTTTITEYVKGVGLVAVKKANNYTMSEGMRLENKITHRVAVEAGKQIAGRDYEHEGHCMACWDGGELVCCDLCPASYHAGHFEDIYCAPPPTTQVLSQIRSTCKQTNKQNKNLLRPAPRLLPRKEFKLGRLPTVKELQGFGTWGCPHHSCAKCKRKAAGLRHMQSQGLRVIEYSCAMCNRKAVGI
ncbi:hypothetical protein T492DRAFT_1151981 [Pavlovales sp. CCMP2436]|nr:hypothetical protein T492DRAFT_1151981 [Pavlovales sp. CCMP2436]